MERKFDIETFEKFLKDVSDEFRMQPSKRIWNSIYNNIHPGRKLPTISVSIVLFASLVILGFLNSENRKSGSSLQIHYASKNKTEKSGKKSTIVFKDKNEISNDESLENYNETSFLSNAYLPESSNNNKLNNRFTLKMLRNLSQKKSQRNDLTKKDIFSGDDTENSYATHYVVFHPQATNEESKNNQNSYSNQLLQKQINKFSWQVYASPSVLYMNGLSLGDNSTNLPDNTAMGIEVGASMQYNFLKNLRLTTGLQLNYSKFSTLANSETNGTGIDPSMNTFSAKGFLNYTDPNPSLEMYQISIPVGVVYKITGSDHLFWNVGASIQPTFLMSGNNQPSDNSGQKNPANASRWNLNAGLETFVSYKIGGITWQLGPQFRYQFLSPNNKSSVFENPSVYGLKLGISRPLK